MLSEILEKLGSDTKTVFADGTFRTAPSMRNGHLYQILKVYVEYKGNTVCVFKAVMTAKSRCLYDAVYERLREILPDSGNLFLLKMMMIFN